MEYVAVGQQVADGEPLALQGGAACEGATHYVRAMTMGAFSLDATASRTVGGSAGAGGVGVSGDTRSGITNVSGGGDLAACKADPKSVRCDAVLQLSVATLPQHAAASKEGGFGRGLGGLTSIPTVGQMRELEVGSDLAKADVALLQLIQAATRLEKNEKENALEKAKMWRMVAEYSGENPFQQSAKKRAEDWDRVALAEAQRAVKAKKDCEKNASDSGKLGKLLAIDDEVLSKSQKDAYQREYDRAYSPFKEILSDCEGWRARAGQPWVATVLERQAQSEKDATERGDQEQQRVVSDKYGTVRKWKKVSTVGGVVLLGGGAAMFATGYLLSKSATTDCVGAACPASAQGKVSTANLVGSIGIVAAAVGAVGLIGGLVWPLPQAPRSEARVHIGPGPGDVGVSTVFKF